MKLSNDEIFIILSFIELRYFSKLSTLNKYFYSNIIKSTIFWKLRLEYMYKIKECTNPINVYSNYYDNGITKKIIKNMRYLHNEEDISNHGKKKLVVRYDMIKQLFYKSSNFSTIENFFDSKHSNLNKLLIKIKEIIFRDNNLNQKIIIDFWLYNLYFVIPSYTDIKIFKEYNEIYKKRIMCERWIIINDIIYNYVSIDINDNNCHDFKIFKEYFNEPSIKLFLEISKYCYQNFLCFRELINLSNRLKNKMKIISDDYIELKNNDHIYPIIINYSHINLENLKNLIDAGFKFNYLDFQSFLKLDIDLDYCEYMLPKLSIVEEFNLNNNDTYKQDDGYEFCRLINDHLNTFSKHNKITYLWKYMLIENNNLYKKYVNVIKLLISKKIYIDDYIYIIDIQDNIKDIIDVDTINIDNNDNDNNDGKIYLNKYTEKVFENVLTSGAFIIDNIEELINYQSINNDLKSNYFFEKLKPDEKKIF